MKKIICILALFLVACANTSSKANTAKADTSTQKKQSEAKESSDIVDLTKMSGTIVYSEVYNMLITPQEYMGKTVIMNGLFNAYENSEGTEMIFGCVVLDATACCAQGLEFILDGEYQYPEDYPEYGSEITVKGVFDVYEKNGYKYVYLNHASFI